jgi:hypothetical protein
MKLFTVEEANRLLPQIIPKLKEIKRRYAVIDSLRTEARAAAAASNFGGGMVGGVVYVNTLYQLGKLTTELHDMGVELKDHSRGLIDFPSLKADRVIYLCWQEGDGDKLAWWHEIDAGFAGRQPL